VLASACGTTGGITISSSSSGGSGSSNTGLPPNPILAVGCIHQSGLQPTLIRPKIEGPGSTFVNTAALFGAVVRTSAGDTLESRYIVFRWKETLFCFNTTWSRKWLSQNTIVEEKTIVILSFSLEMCVFFKRGEKEARRKKGL